MIPNKFAYFHQGSRYRSEKAEENINDNSIIFIEDDASIATHGKIFGVRGVYPGEEQENLTDEGNTSIKVITTNPLFPLDDNGRPLVGTTISVKFKYTNSYKTAGTPMQLNVNGIGPYNISYNGTDYVSTTSANTTFCGTAKREVLYTFRVDTNPDNGAEMPHWVFISHGYESGNTNTIGYQLRHNSSTLPASDKFYRYRLLFTSADGKKYVPANTSTSTNATAKRDVNQRPIDPFGEILYYSSTSSVAAGSSPGATVLWEEYTFTLGYSFNRTGAALVLTYPAPVYVVCTPQNDGSAIMDAVTPYVQSLPSTNDGKIYIFLGIAYAATTVELMPDHPVYYHDGTGIRIWTGKELPDKPIDLVEWYSEHFSNLPTTENEARALTTDEINALSDIINNNYSWTLEGQPLVANRTWSLCTWECVYHRTDVTPYGDYLLKYYIERVDNKYYYHSEYSQLVFIDDLATVATSGSYNDLTNKPDLSALGTLVVTVTSTGSGSNIVYALSGGSNYTAINTALGEGREVVLKYGDKIYCLSKKESDKLTFTSLQGNDNTYSAFDIDTNSRVSYYSGSIITSETALSKGTTTGQGNAVTDITVSGHQITLTKGKTFLESVGTLNTNNSTTLAVPNSPESFGGNISLHKISKTGSYNDLLNKPDLTSFLTSETNLTDSSSGDGNAVTGISTSGHHITWTKGKTFLETGDISDWAKASTKPTYTASEVGALPANTHIPVDPVQSDWEETNSTSLAYIQHKPEVPKVVYGKKTSSGFLQGILEQGGTWSYIFTPVTPEKKVHYIDVNTYQTYIWNGTSYVRLDQEAFDGPTEQKTVINISWDQNNVLSFSYADDNTSITSADVLALLQEEGNDIIFKKEDYYYILQYKTSSSWWYQCFEGDASTFHYFSLGNSSGNLVLDECGDREFALLNSPGFTGTPTAPTATSGTSTTQIATTAFVQSAINALPTPMVFQGTIGTGGTSTTVPSTPTEGDTYKIITGGTSLTFSGITDTIKVGDTVVYKNSTVGWILIPSGDEPSGTVTSIGMSVPTGLTVTTSPNGNNPITDSGTFNITYTSGYSIPLDADQESWNAKANIVFIKKVNNVWKKVTYSNSSHDWVVDNSTLTGDPKNIYIDVLGCDAYYYDPKTSSFVVIDEDYAAEIDEKQDILYDSTSTIPAGKTANIKTINNQSLLGSGNLTPSQLGVPSIANNLTTTTTGSVLDATQGKILKDLIDTKQSAIEIIDLT